MSDDVEEFEKAIVAYGVGKALAYFATPRDKYLEFEALIPKPEAHFDWEAEGFWAKIKGTGDARYFSKINDMIWVGIYKEELGSSMFTKKRIKESFDPCPPPSWAHLITELK